MLSLIKTQKQENKIIFLKGFFGNFNIYYIEQIILKPKKINFFFSKNQLTIQKDKNNFINLNIEQFIYIFITKKSIFFYINNINFQKNKKSILKTYKTLISLKIKGLIQGFKLTLFLKGLGFKASIENNFLILKLGYSHLILEKIPENIQVIQNQANKLIFSSKNWIELTQYVNFIKSYKKPEPYKGKGLVFKNENINRKEGKKSKK